MKKILATLIGTLLAASQLHANAQAKADERSLTGQPNSFTIEAQQYAATGYGAARLGMTIEEVKAAVSATYPGSFNNAQDVIIPVQATRAVAIVVPQVAPGPGPATITYVFGARSQRLIAVNIYWQVDGVATAAQQESLTAGAQVLAGRLIGYQWPLFQSTRGRVLGPGALIVFAGKDAAGGGVEVRLDGVAFDVEQPGSQGRPEDKRERRIPPPGPARLKLSIVANVDRPDVAG